MLIRSRRLWEPAESAVTPQSVFLSRRKLVQAFAAGPILAAAGALPRPALGATEAGLYPARRNDAFNVPNRRVTDETLVTSYNNFYEFGSHKQISEAAQALQPEPWSVVVDGMVEEERTVDAAELIRQMPLEERIYRLRCVEAWSAVVPWTGFPMKALVDWARPLSDARYVRMETFQDTDVAPGQRQFWYPWPYIEGLTMAEATNELAFIGTGLYGRPMPNQNGAPIRLVVPWKYGFKSIKSIVRFTFTDEQPVSFWEEIQPAEYGFWANVNPEVPHPRWSQATERPLGEDDRIPTLLFNGYAEQVAGLYADREQDEILFR